MTTVFFKGVTRTELDAILKQLNDMLTARGKKPLHIHGAFNKVQLTNEDESYNVTGFMSKNELRFYMVAMMDGMDIIK